ncbi:MAG: acyl-CoA mutase large subunit family protein [Candidatus Eisenbacteria bacterium]|nr:acyl-CoA mutase large subunit family protein [Candidatus Eisenbacteria bacterium]
MADDVSGGADRIASIPLRDDFPLPGPEEWREEAIRLLKGRPFEKTLFTETDEGITLRPIYDAEDVKDLPGLGAAPGEAPFLRGCRAAGYRADGWYVAQELPFPTYDEFNRALRHDLERGQTAVNLILDRAAQAGLDPDQAEPGDVGRGGTSIASVIGLSRALEGVDLERTPVYLQPGSAAMPVAALLIALARKRGTDPARLRGSVGMDPMTGLAVHGRLPVSLDRAYDELAHLTRWAAENAPMLRTLAAYGFAWHEGGGDAVQELAFTLASAVEALRRLEQRGLGVEIVAPRILFGLSAGTGFFPEIAKFRAARLLWHRALEGCGRGDLAARMHIHARTSSVDSTTFDRHVNILRGTTQAFAAVMGGCDSLHVEPFDRLLGLPGDTARRIARNTQTILREECRFDRVIDPAGGGWAVESLTHEMARRAWDLFREIEEAGGMPAALLNGIPQSKIAETARNRRKRVAVRTDVLIGVNRYPNREEGPPVRRFPDYESIHARRAARLRELRVSPEHAEQIRVLEKLGTILRSKPEDLFEAAADAALHGATIGEFTRMLRRGEDEETRVEPIPTFRSAHDYEVLRATVLEWRARSGAPPQVFFANIGPPSAYMARLEFTRSFYEIGGFETIHDRSFETPGDAAREALASEAPAVAIVSTDDRYPEAVPAIVAALRAAPNPPRRIILAGFPKEHADAFREAGVDEFIHLRADALASLRALADTIGVKR